MTVTLLPQFQARTTHRPYIILAALQVLDVATTGFILNAWTERAEGNPIAAFILNHGGLVPGLTVLLALKLAIVWVFWSCQTKTKIVTTIYTAVIVNNLLFIVLWFLR
jgi:hypothetical protein